MGRFDGFEREVRGPWEPKWYGGVIVAEYETSGSFAAIHKTEDRLSEKGDSRNLKLCVRVVNGGKLTKDLNYTLNYRPQALDPERITEVKAIQDEMKKRGITGAWPDKLAQRDALSLSR